MNASLSLISSTFSTPLLEPNKPLRRPDYEFIKENWYEGHWQSVAKRARDLVKSKIDQSDLQAIVNCRAKQEKSLREKLTMRYKNGKNYQTIDDIRNDLFDLAGVRVILIVPTPEQHQKVKSIIHSIWGTHVEEKLHEGSAPSGTYKAKHVGYQAMHYKPFMLKSQGDDKYKYKDKDRVEVQVVSALGNVWAEAGHDVLYKTHAYGEPTLEECRILDALNGIVLSGEVLLEQFHEAFLKRTKTALKHSGELRVFLDQLDILKGCEQRNEFSVAGLDILFQCLKQTNKNYPLAVRNALKELGYGKNEDELQLDEIITRLEPGEPEIADNMRATFCLIYRIMVDQETTSANGLRPLYQLSKIRPSEVPKCCSIMVTAFTLLQDFLGGPHHAKTFLQSLDLEVTEDEIKHIPNFGNQDGATDVEKTVNGRNKALEWILADSSRQIVLGDECEETLEKSLPYLQPLWSWFQIQAENENSIFGLCFRLAEMRPIKDFASEELLLQLRIESLAGARIFRQGRQSGRGDPSLCKGKASQLARQKL